MEVIISVLKRWWRGTDPALVDLADDYQLFYVVQQAWAGGFTVSSELARSEAAYVAIAASLGLITTQEPDGSFGRTWHVTMKGMLFMETFIAGEP